ncbi:MAG TPA: energy transducer TonB [Candidatus Acidoferrales bacterium]|nr:energy transducer TonB [Candidatus Acidoferrales bacterium]
MSHTSSRSPEKPQDLAATPLGKCLVEADPNVKTGALRARRKAMGASVAIEVAVVAALMIWPLFAAGTRLISPRHSIPLPLYGAPHSTNPVIHYVPWSLSRPVPSATRMGDTTVSPGIPVIDGATGSENSRVTGLIAVDNFGGAPPSLPQPPAPAAKPLAPVRRSEGVQAALLIHRVEPEYPALARQARVEGTVELHAVIARDGAIEFLEALNGHPLLVKAALDAVQQWRYRPTMLGTEAVEVDTYITVHFVLGQPEPNK